MFISCTFLLIVIFFILKVWNEYYTEYIFSAVEISICFLLQCKMEKIVLFLQKWQNKDWDLYSMSFP